MTERSPRRRTPLTALLVTLVVLAAVASTVFKLFEPVFVHTSGWSPMPREVAFPLQQVVHDQRYAAQARAGQTLLEAARRRMDAPAFSAAIAIDGELVWASASGFADLDARRPVDVKSRFRLGSTSKAVTAVAVGTLLDRGLLDLDAQIQAYVPRYPVQRWPMSVRQVMSHRAGVRDYGLCFCFPIWEHQNRRHFENMDAAIAVVAESALLFEPGTSFRYTSLGYNLVGGAIEGAAKVPFGRYIADAVFRPLAMTGSGLDSVPGAEADRVAFYEVEQGRFKHAFPVDNSIRWPSGGLLSTPSDMARLGSAMLDDRLLSENTRRALVTVPAGGGARGAQHYALGWRTGQWTLFDGAVSTLAYHHGGTAVGSTSMLVVLPEYRMVVSAMMNKGGTNVDDLVAASDQIVQAFIDRAVSPGTAPQG
jgi:CubicO group peptidase (beta-lactamase class C family)